MHAYETRPLDLDSPDLHAQWLALLKENGLTPEASVDATIGVFDGPSLVAAGSRFRNILKLIAVNEAHRGGEAFNRLLDALLKDAFLQGFAKLFVYTKPAVAPAFHALGFRELVTYGGVLTFMERGRPAFAAYLASLRARKVPANTAGAIVMHANPFTNGHLHLVEAALTACDVVYVFVLSEDRGLFPPAVRLDLVEAGTRHLNEDQVRVVVLPTDDYLVSSPTFPAYFLPDSNAAARTQAGIDALLFKTAIAPALDIRCRFVGEEPLSAVTKLYNDVLADTLQGSPELRILPRLAVGGAPVSASRVRRLWLNGQLDALAGLVPPATYAYLSAHTR